MHRLLVLARVVDKLGPIKGEKCIQKIVYLLQSRGEPLGYVFLWKNFGPVCPELLSDLRELEELGLITIQFDNRVPIYSRNTNLRTATRYWQNRYTHLELPSSIASQLSSIRNFIQDTDADPLSLEIIASLEYLRKRKVDDPVVDLVNSSQGRISRDKIERISALTNFPGE